MSFSIGEILGCFPIQHPYRFIDNILSADDRQLTGCYRFKENEFFYSGHFPGFAVTPGAILTEMAAQVGLLAFGMHLLGNNLVQLSEIPEMVPAGLPRVSDILLASGKMLPDFAGSEILRYLFFLSSVELTYKHIVRPGEQITVCSELIFFRLNKLKCNIRMRNEDGKVVSRGVISGIVVADGSWETE